MLNKQIGWSWAVDYIHGVDSVFRYPNPMIKVIILMTIFDSPELVATNINN